MKPRHALLILLVLLLAGKPAQAVTGSSYPVDKAVELVRLPALGFAGMSPFELQVHYRLKQLLHKAGYTFEDSHTAAWRKLMLDKNENIYARICAAYFLLDSDEKARTFISQQVRSKDLRHRYNAAEAVRFYVARDATKSWGVDLLIELLADGSLDDTGVEESPRGRFPNGDRLDIKSAPVEQVCSDLGYMKEPKAVDALISVLQRCPDVGGAAFALGEIGDPKATPVLLKVLRSGTGDQHRIIVALGKFKCREAVPILTGRLGDPQSSTVENGEVESEVILEALLAIGDQRAVPSIERYSKENHRRESIAVARRVLVQFKSADPTIDLLALLDAETDAFEKCKIISTLVKYPNARVVAKLNQLAKTSDSAVLRRDAIFALRDIKTREALLGLADLIDYRFPKHLKSFPAIGKGDPPDFSEYFPELIVGLLKQTTSQDFGFDKSRWVDWITSNMQDAKEAQPSGRQ